MGFLVTNIYIHKRWGKFLILDSGGKNCNYKRKVSELERLTQLLNSYLYL